VALTPGFLRSETMLEHFGVSEANWKSAGEKPDSLDFLQSESPRFVGRAAAALAADPEASKKSGRVFTSWALAREYGFTDVDGTRPDWGAHAAKTYGTFKICGKNFYEYWNNGLIDKIFPDWY